MAISTDNEKLALMSYNAVMQPPMPTSSDGLGQDDKQHLIWQYPGVLWTEAVAEAEVAAVAPAVEPAVPAHLIRRRHIIRARMAYAFYMKAIVTKKHFARSLMMLVLPSLVVDPFRIARRYSVKSRVSRQPSTGTKTKKAHLMKYGSYQRTVDDLEELEEMVILGLFDTST